MKLIVAFRNFAKVPKNCLWLISSFFFLSFFSSHAHIQYFFDLAPTLTMHIVYCVQNLIAVNSNVGVQLPEDGISDVETCSSDIWLYSCISKVHPLVS